MRWRGVLLLAASVAAGAAQAGWSGPAQPVRFAPERDYGPFVFQREDGRIDGLSVEMLGLLQQHTGLTVATLPARPLREQLDALRRREADLLSSLRATPERGEYALFTLPYVSVPAVVVMREEAPALTLAQMAARPVAVGEGYAVEAVVRARHPEVAWRAVPDDVAALQGLLAGRFDAAVLDAASFAYTVRRHALQGLRVVAPADFEYALSFAVRKDWPELREALDGAIRAVPASRRQAVLQRWIDHPAAPARTPWASRVGAALLGLGLLVAMVAGGWRWNERRKRQA